MPCPDVVGKKMIYRFVLFLTIMARKEIFPTIMVRKEIQKISPSLGPELKEYL